MNSKRAVSMLLTGALVASTWSGVLIPLDKIYAESTLILEENFNGAEIGTKPVDYELAEEKGNISIVGVPSDKDKSLFLDDQGDKNVKITKSFDKQEKVITAVVDFMQPALGSTAKVIRLMDEDGEVAVHIETKSGAISYKNADDSFTELCKYEKEKWYTIQAVADIPSGTADIYINGELKLEKAPFYKGVTNLTKFDSYTPGSGVKGHYLDDIKIYTGASAAEVSEKAKMSAQVEVEPVEEKQPSKDTTTENTPKVEKPVDKAEPQSIYEAEDAVMSGAIVDTKHAGFTGTGFVDHVPNAPGAYIEWTVNAPAAGDYMLVFRYGNGASENRPCEIKVNGEVVVPELAFNSTGEWNNWQTTSTKATLKEGANIIRATGTGPSGGGNIDNLEIQYVYDKTYEAEDAVMSGAIVDTKHVGFTGTGFVDHVPNAPGAYIEWTVDVPADGDYALAFRYGNGASENRPCEIKVNDTVVAPELAFNSTGEWNNWQTSSTIAFLKKGKNIIRATGTGPSGGGNIDNLRICSPGLIADDANKPIEINEVKVSEIVGDILGKKLESEGLLVSDDYFDEKDKVEVSNQQSKNVEITSVNAVTSSVVLVTLDGYFEDFDPYDIMISAATNSWDALAADFKDLQIKRGAVGRNKLGNTVVIYELAEELNENGGYDQEKKDVVFSGDLEAMTKQAFNLVSWQMEHGGWTKNHEEEFKKPWDGKAPRSEWFSPDGVELGTIDNNATIDQINYIAEVYRQNKLNGKDIKELKDSLTKGIDFLLTMQYDNGGFPQVYPARGNYSDYVTFNDEGMIRVLNLFDDILNQQYPYDKEILDEKYYPLIQDSMDRAVDYILKAQIKVDGKLTAWCAQHDPVTYAPMKARAYEHPSISGKESVGIVKFLMSRPNQTEEIKKSVKAALEWFDEVKVEGMRYVSGDKNKVFFVEDPKADLWYRFYEIGTNKPIFSGRDSVIKYSIHEIEEERQMGYQWAGNYASTLLEAAKTTGYYEGKVYARVVNAKSKDINGRTLAKGDTKVVNNLASDLAHKATRITVGKDKNSDYNSVQAAIDAVPTNNVYPIEIFIKNGTYKEEINIPADKSFITMIGESKENTILTYDNYAGKEKESGGTYGTTGSASTYIYANDFRAENITFENSFDESKYDGSGTQAVAVYTSGERQSFINCRFIGNQDTLYTRRGTQYFYKSYIEGDVDFIFGEAQAVFEECDIVSLDRGSDENNGYITAASTKIDKPYGYLFINSKITSEAKDGTVYLGRPWHPSKDPNAIASVVYMNCYLGSHINKDGWHDMSGFKAEDARFYEYKNEGPGAVEHARGKQLTDEEAAKYTIENVLGGWNPKK